MNAKKYGFTSLVSRPLPAVAMAALPFVTACSSAPDQIPTSTTRQSVDSGESKVAPVRKDVDSAPPYVETGRDDTAQPAPPAAPAPPVAGEQASPSARDQPTVAAIASEMRVRTLPAASAKSTQDRLLYAPSPVPYPVAGAVDRENYAHYQDNPVHITANQPVSTFSIDVDTGSYTNVRRMLEQGRLPPADAVRAEEFINYFNYAYAPPADRDVPFSVTTEIAPAPWNAQRELLLVGIQGYRVPAAQIPAVNLVFLIDTSGSMNEADKLPLLQASLKQLVPQLGQRDRVAIVTYAGSAGLALASTPGDQHARISAAIDAMRPGGSTNGQAGIELAYAEARQGFIEGGVNRVILATDGDFNVGQVSIDALKDETADKRRSGIAFSTLGFGTGNYNDAMAVQLADVGNGSHHYIDSLSEARKVLVDEMSATLMTIAKDVKIRIEFNPAQVREYRLIGYVKRMLRRENFNNDAIDAGGIGAGANVTALYEITPTSSSAARIDPLRYGGEERASESARHGKSGELAWLRLRYKLPGHDASQLIERAVQAHDTRSDPTPRLRFVAAVAAFAESLRGGAYLDDYPLTQIATLARSARGADPHGYRAGLVRLVELTEGLRTPGQDPQPLEKTAMRR